jgi:hypothetical protein
MMDVKLKRRTPFYPQTHGQRKSGESNCNFPAQEMQPKASQAWHVSLSYTQHCYNRVVHCSNNKSTLEKCLLGFLPCTPSDITLNKVVGSESTTHEYEQQKTRKFVERIQQIHRYDNDEHPIYAYIWKKLYFNCTK